MTRARRHRRLSAILAFGLLALAAELIGRSLTHRLDVGRHFSAPGYAGTDYYPILLGVVKLGIALLLARLVWRFVRARSAARGARRLISAFGRTHEHRLPRLQLDLSLPLWLLCFAVTAAIYLVQTDVERASEGRWPLLGPWLHSSALPVFAVLALGMAVAWRAVRLWLSDYEAYAQETVAYARSLGDTLSPPLPAPRETAVAPRRLFGLAFESRPPPLTA